MFRPITILFVISSVVLQLSEGTEYVDDSWNGKWFPQSPNARVNQDNTHDSHNIPMGITDSKCDNAEDNLDIDFNPTSEVDKLMYTCLDRSTKYEPSYKIQPLLRKYVTPPTYIPLHKCLNESISYDIRLPTYGTHRPNWPKYGEYKYVPIQRWLHSVEHGGVVMLYHPCANSKEVEKLKLIVKNCLYRHIITPSKRLQAERPLALVTWGKSLELSVVYEPLITQFIKENALKGPEKISKDGQYEKLLLENAQIISDQDDSTICPKITKLN